MVLPSRGEGISIVAFVNEMDHLVPRRIKIDADQILAVFRGDDLLASTARQILIYRMLRE